MDIAVKEFILETLMICFLLLTGYYFREDIRLGVVLFFMSFFLFAAKNAVKDTERKKHDNNKY